MIDVGQLSDEEAIGAVLLFGVTFWYGPLSECWFIDQDIPGFEGINDGWKSKGDCARAFCRWKFGRQT